jgi:hypothetical protein
MDYLIHITTLLLESKTKLSDFLKVTSGRAGISTKSIGLQSPVDLTIGGFNCSCLVLYWEMVL